MSQSRSSSFCSYEAGHCAVRMPFLPVRPHERCRVPRVCAARRADARAGQRAVQQRGARGVRAAGGDQRGGRRAPARDERRCGVADVPVRRAADGCAEPDGVRGGVRRGRGRRTRVRTRAAVRGRAVHGRHAPRARRRRCGQRSPAAPRRAARVRGVPPARARACVCGRQLRERLGGDGRARRVCVLHDEGSGIRTPFPPHTTVCCSSPLCGTVSSFVLSFFRSFVLLFFCFFIPSFFHSLVFSFHLIFRIYCLPLYRLAVWLVCVQISPLAVQSFADGDFTHLFRQTLTRCLFDYLLNCVADCAIDSVMSG